MVPIRTSISVGISADVLLQIHPRCIGQAQEHHGASLKIYRTTLRKRSVMFKNVILFCAIKKGFPVLGSNGQYLALMVEYIRCDAV